MLSCGQNSNQLIKTLSNQIDDVDFYSYYSVKEFISQSKLRHLAFDRLVFTSKFINTDEDMSTLCDYIRAELNSTEIVMILSKQQRNLEDIFKAYFDSPMHSVMYLDSPTTLNIVNAVKLPIADVKARYYYFDRPDQGNTDKKSTKFGLFRGGKKNKNQNDEIQKDAVNSTKTSENIISSGVNVGDDAKNQITGNPYENNSNFESNLNVNNKDNIGNQDFNSDASSLGGNFVSPSENQSTNSDDFDLTIGDYGSQHSDSGFVGDDEKDELEKFLRDQQKDVSDTTSGVYQPQGVVNDNSNPYEVGSRLQMQDNSRGTNYSAIDSTATPSNSMSSDRGKSNRAVCVVSIGKINIITGLQGSGATAYLVNTASRLKAEGNRVLVVDLDYRSNGLLSFINTNSFYSSGCNGGIDSKVMYSEDGIDILSNGYGVPIKTDISLFINNSALNRYDVVLVDCPLDCLDVIPEIVFCSSNIVVCCISDISKLIETSERFNDRGIISLGKEKYLVNKCKVANKLIKPTDIEKVKNTMLFPNGCWLDNIG